jgi:uncharacterized protein (DUF1330 family)
MKAQVVIACGLGIVIGAAVTENVAAQKTPPAYFIAEAVIKDVEADRKIIAKLPATAEKYGGRYLARGGRIISFGGEPPKRVIIAVFDSMDKVQAWRADPETKALEEERQTIGTTLRHYAVEGIAQ